MEGNPLPRSLSGFHFLSSPRVPLCSLDCPGIGWLQNPSAAPVSRVLGLKVCAITPGSSLCSCPEQNKTSVVCFGEYQSPIIPQPSSYPWFSPLLFLYHFRPSSHRRVISSSRCAPSSCYVTSGKPPHLSESPFPQEMG